MMKSMVLVKCKKCGGKWHEHNASCFSKAGNPLNPKDSTIAGKFWSK